MNKFLDETGLAYFWGKIKSKGWISSDDSTPSDPATINADSLGGLPAANYATNESVDGKISALDADSVNAANKDLSNLSDYQRALRNIGGRPNKNIIINHRMIGTGDPGDFPINQRGQKIYTPDWLKYSLDMWCVEANQEIKIEIKDGFVTLTNTSSDRTLQFKQLLPNNVLEAGEMYTLSTYVKSITGEVLFQVGMTDPPYQSPCIVSPKANDIVSTTVDALPHVSSGGWKCFYLLPPGSAITIADQKLEHGPVQTLGWKDDTGNVHLFENADYRETLAQCQQYYRRMYLTYLRFTHYDGTNARAGIPVQGMRVAPACSIIGTPSVYNSNNWGTVSVNLSVSARPRPDDAKASDSDIIVVTAANAPSADIVCNDLIVELSSEL